MAELKPTFWRTTLHRSRAVTHGVTAVAELKLGYCIERCVRCTAVTHGVTAVAELKPPRRDKNCNVSEVTHGVTAVAELKLHASPARIHAVRRHPRRHRRGRIEAVTRQSDAIYWPCHPRRHRRGRIEASTGGGSGGSGVSSPTASPPWPN